MYIYYTKGSTIPEESTILQESTMEALKNGKKKNCIGSDHLDHGECMNSILPVRDALDILSGKWKLPIIIALSFGNKRFSQIAREVPGITDKMLSKELRDLEMNELVKRTVFDSVPVIVEYSMTPYGRSLHKVISELRKWGVQHRKRIMK
jgi:DNA-binding HxlR family transcriptional regulator